MPTTDPIKGIIGTSPPMQEVFRVTRKVAPSAATVLLTGETGTGKELIARALHELSNRATAAYEAACTRAAKFLNAPQEECIVFTRGTTESINLVANT